MKIKVNNFTLEIHLILEEEEEEIQDIDDITILFIISNNIIILEDHLDRIEDFLEIEETFMNNKTKLFI